VTRPRHTRKDSTHRALLENARALGMVAWDTSDIGGQVLDCILFWRGMALPVEIKARGHEHDFTAGEIEGMRALSSVGIQPAVAVTIDDVLSAFERMEAR